MSRERVQQIRAMKEQCKSLNPVVSGDDTQWFIQLVDKNMRELYKIFLTLPRGFPTTPPRVTLSVPLGHPWVDPNSKVVNHPSIVSWSRESEIGRIMMDILKEFTTKKPVVMQDVVSTPRVGVGSQAPSPARPSGVIETVAFPVLPTEYSELNDLSLEQLEAMEADPNLLDAYLDKLVIVQKYKQVASETKSKSRELAMTISEDYDKLLNSQFMQDTQLAQIHQTKAILETLLVQKDAMLCKFTPKNLLSDLTAIVARTEKETSRLLSEMSSIEEVKPQLIEQRMLHHKANALSELLSAHSTSRIFT